jgi:hypothetical protein
MLNKPFRIFALGICLGLFVIAGICAASTLTYSPLAPQTGDSDLIIAHKAAVAQTSLAGGNSFAHISTATTTVVKASPGVLDKIQVNTVGSASTITIYDNASAGSGTVIASGVGTSLVTFNYNVATANGITIVTTGTPDITVSYR